MTASHEPCLPWCALNPTRNDPLCPPSPWFPSSAYQLFFFFLINLVIYFWLCWVFVSVRGFSLVAASRGHSSSRCMGLSLSRPLLLQSTGSRHAGSVIVAHGPSCSTACGILPDQGSHLCPLHWQADSQPLRHQRSPAYQLLWNRNLHLQWTHYWARPRDQRQAMCPEGAHSPTADEKSHSQESREWHMTMQKKKKELSTFPLPRPPSLLLRPLRPCFCPHRSCKTAPATASWFPNPMDTIYLLSYISLTPLSVPSSLHSSSLVFLA